MNIDKTLSFLEKKYSKKISWHLFSPFYADSEGAICEEGVLIFNINTRFYCFSDNVDTSFDAIDVLTLQHSKKDDALSYISGKTAKIKYLGSLPAAFCDSLDVIELDNNRTLFLKLKGTEFKQMLKIAASKQKYSMEEYNRTKETK